MSLLVALMFIITDVDDDGHMQTLNVLRHVNRSNTNKAYAARIHNKLEYTKRGQRRPLNLSPFRSKNNETDSLVTTATPFSCCGIMTSLFIVVVYLYIFKLGQNVLASFCILKISHPSTATNSLAFYYYFFLVQ